MNCFINMNWFNILVCLSFCSKYSVSQDYNDIGNGRCTKTVSEPYTEYERRLVTYLETYQVRCRLIFTCTKTRINSYFTRVPVKKTKSSFSTVCCPGFEAMEEDLPAIFFGCKPTCTKPCGKNAKCVSPDVCSCEEGFLKDAGDVCQPHCQPACGENSTCVAPNTCECSKGYNIVNGTCQPVCSLCLLKHATCIAPETCRCEDGYRAADGECRPWCENCTQGTCVKPGLCVCNDGYNKNENGRCSPVCVGCENGDCISPDRCECRKGYASVNSSCVPECLPQCSEHETCSAPNNCICKPGFQRDEGGECHPKCSISCNNGVCFGPEKCSCLLSCLNNETSSCVSSDCTCSAGYSLEGTICRPVCSLPCLNSTCLEPDRCECTKGYKIKEDTWNVCEPYCSDGCDNGTCVAPEICECAKGYKLNDNGKCGAQCTRGCADGICVGTNRCECLKGYKLKEDSDHECEPVCVSGCENGTCVAPDHCACPIGYKLKDSSHNECEPLCTQGCGHGTCTAPEVCVCKGNDLYLDVNHHCVPCDCGANMRCSSPNGTCECSDGYARLENSTACVRKDEMPEECEGCIKPACEGDSCNCTFGYVVKVVADKAYCQKADKSNITINESANKTGSNAALEQDTESSWGIVVYVLMGGSMLLVLGLVLIVVRQRRSVQSFTAWFRREGAVTSEAERPSERGTSSASFLFTSGSEASQI